MVLALDFLSVRKPKSVGVRSAVFIALLGHMTILSPKLEACWTSWLGII